jgi:uncharacterized membrane protein YfcA
MQFFIILIITGAFAGVLGGLLGIGGGIVLMPILRFVIGLSPAQAAGTCILAVFFTTLGGSFRHYRLRHINIKSILPVIVAGVVSTVVFSVFFTSLANKPNWLDLGTGLVFFLVSARMVIGGLADFDYDNLDRLSVATYIDDANEVFTMDDLGNRLEVNLKTAQMRSMM